MKTNQSHVKWLQGPDTGISSETIFSIATGIPVKNHDIPHDIADVGRCVRMLRQLPELKESLPQVANLYAKWRPFIDCWPQLERLYDECVEWESKTTEEQKKLSRRKRFVNPNTYAWNVMQQLGCASKYLDGWKAQGSLNSWKKEEAKNV